MSIARSLISLGTAVVLALSAIACGGDAGTEAGTETGTATGTGTGTQAAASCTPVGDADAATGEIDVRLDEWTVEPEDSTAEEGSITFVADNEGDEAHELVIVRAEDAKSLPVDDMGAVDEEALEEGGLIGEIEAFPAGQECEGTFEMAAGDYVLFCNIVTQTEDEIVSHFQKGMHTQFEVTK